MPPSRDLGVLLLSASLDFAIFVPMSGAVFLTVLREECADRHLPERKLWNRPRAIFWAQRKSTFGRKTACGLRHSAGTLISSKTWHSGNRALLRHGQLGARSHMRRFSFAILRRSLQAATPLVASQLRTSHLELLGDRPCQQPSLPVAILRFDLVVLLVK